MATPLSLVLIENDDPLRQVLVRLLEPAGYRVHAYGCVEDFDDDLTIEPVDLFLLDVQLPGESGLALCERLRATHPWVGIAILSGLVDANDLAHGYRKGADLYLAKPLHAETLLPALANLAQRVGASHHTAKDTQLRLDPQRAVLIGQSDEIQLNLAQSQLLIALSRAPQQRLATWQIVELFGLNPEKDNKLLIEQRLSRLRRKLDAVGCKPDALQACYGEGYRLTLPIGIFS
ncbi:MAG: DNA-binding response regulator [Pseudomonadota bacterium]